MAVTIADEALTDLFTATIAVAAAAILLGTKMNPTWLIFAAGLGGVGRILL